MGDLLPKHKNCTCGLEKIFRSLSLSNNTSINSWIHQDKYLNFYLSLNYPSVDDIVKTVILSGTGYKVDINHGVGNSSLTLEVLTFYGSNWEITTKTNQSPGSDTVVFSLKN